MAKTTPSRAKSKTKAPKKKPTQLDRIERSLGLIESKLATLNAWETLNEAMSNDKLASPTVAVEGLRNGDYTEASKEVADKLTEMGWNWSDNDRTRCNIIGYYDAPPRVLNCHRATIEDAHYPPAKFLARAAVTAQELGLKDAHEAKVKAEAQAAEDAKLVFGARVEHISRGKGIWMGMDGILHELAFLNHGEGRLHQWSIVTCPRLTFTLLP